MTEPLNLAHLRSLVAVVDRSSFTRAAHVLHLSQSTVSQHVRLLERRVGTELFVREQRGLKLTPHGGEFVDRARGLLAEHDELVGDFTGTGSGCGRRPLAIGSTEHAADQMLPTSLRACASYRACRRLAGSVCTWCRDRDSRTRLPIRR